MLYDIIVVGTGPAGLTAAVYARRAGKSVLVLEKETFGGQITHSPKVENYPGFKEMSGNEFAEKLMDQALYQGAEIDMREVLDVVDEGETKKVVTDCGDLFCKALIIASGSKHRVLGVKDEDKYTGEGVSYCAVCDGAFYAGQHVAVIGGGNSALQEAVMLSERCRRVTVVQNLSFLTGEQQLIRKLNDAGNVDFIYDSVVDALVGDEKLRGVVLHDTKADEKHILTCDGIFVAIGQVPDNKAFAGVAEIDDRGYIVAGEDCRTSHPGVFAAGDCRVKAVRQITTATGDGAVAAVSACRYIDSL